MARALPIASILAVSYTLGCAGSSQSAAQQPEEPLAIKQPQAEPLNDPKFAEQKHLRELAIPAVWDSADGEGITVAVFDNGFWADDPDVADAYVGDEIRFSDVVHRADLMCSAHGSSMVTTIVAKHGNATGFAGIAPKAKVLRIANGCPKWVSAKPAPSPEQRLAAHTDYLHQIMEQGAGAIDQVVADGARIINMSFVLPKPGQMPELDLSIEKFRAAIKRAGDAGVIIVGGAGNWVGQWEEASKSWKGQPRGELQLPAGYPEVVSAGCACGDGICGFEHDGAAIGLPRGSKILVGHNYGEGLDFVVPCDGVPMVMKQDETFTYQLKAEGGTSNATPQVVGVMALVWSAYPSLTSQQVIEALQKTATDLGEPGPDPKTGYGRVNATAALIHAASLVKTDK